MARARIAPGTVGPVGVFPMGYDSTDDGRTEVTIPRPSTDGGETLDYPKGIKVGAAVKVETPDGMREFVVTRWRGLARAVDTDGHSYQVVRFRDTKAAAIAATEQAGRDKLAELARAREAASAPDGTTVGKLLGKWREGLHDPSNKLHESTKDDYESTIKSLLGEPLRPTRDGRERPRSPERMAMAEAFAPVAAMRPADIDARTLKDLFRSIADTNGRGSAIKVRSILAHVWDLAMEDRKLGVQVNVVRALRGTESNPVIPDRVKRETTLDPRRAPSDGEYAALVAALAGDPEAGPMTPGKRNKSAHGQAGGGEPNGKDIRDLVALLFFTGMRQGEALALRWSDIVLDGSDPHVSVTATLTYTPGAPLRRTPTKTRGGTRSVYLVPQAVAMLRRRAEFFGVELTGDRPVFGSPQFPDRFRDPNNLNRAIRTIFDRHGFTWGRSHVGRKFVVNHLLRQGVPLPEVARVVGWSDVLTVTKYADTTGAVSAPTRTAMEASQR